MSRAQRRARFIEAVRLRRSHHIRSDAEAHFVGDTVSPYAPDWHHRFHVLAARIVRKQTTPKRSNG